LRREGKRGKERGERFSLCSPEEKKKKKGGDFIYPAVGIGTKGEKYLYSLDGKGEKNPSSAGSRVVGRPTEKEERHTFPVFREEGKKITNHPNHRAGELRRGEYDRFNRERRIRETPHKAAPPLIQESQRAPFSTRVCLL